MINQHPFFDRNASTTGCALDQLTCFLRYALVRAMKFCIFSVAKACIFLLSASGKLSWAVAEHFPIRPRNIRQKLSSSFFLPQASLAVLHATKQTTFWIGGMRQRCMVENETNNTKACWLVVTGSGRTRNRKKRVSVSLKLLTTWNACHILHVSPVPQAHVSIIKF